MSHKTFAVERDGKLVHGVRMPPGELINMKPRFFIVHPPEYGAKTVFGMIGYTASGELTTHAEMELELSWNGTDPGAARGQMMGRVNALLVEAYDAERVLMVDCPKH